MISNQSVAATVVCILLSSVAWAQPMQNERPRIVVNGEAVIHAKPDKIVIVFGIETVDKDIVAAKQQNNDILKKTVEAMKECGLDEADIQTSQLSIEPRWRNEYRMEDFIGYVARNTLVITLTETGKVEDVVTQALESGVNYLHGVSFQTTQLKKYRDEARELALKAAREKAEKMANVLGQTVGAPQQIHEGGSPWQYYSNWSGWGGGRLGNASWSNVQTSADAVGAAGEITDSLALGKLAIRADVSVVFELTQMQ